MTAPAGCPIVRFVRGQEGVCPPSRQQVDVLAIYRELAGRRDPEAAYERAERIRQQRLVRVLPELPSVLAVEQSETVAPAVAAGTIDRPAIAPMGVPDELATARFRRFGRGSR